MKKIHPQDLIKKACKLQNTTQTYLKGNLSKKPFMPNTKAFTYAPPFPLSFLLLQCYTTLRFLSFWTLNLRKRVTYIIYILLSKEEEEFEEDKEEAMCHPGVPFVSQEGLVVHRGWLVFQVATVARHAPTAVTGQAHGGGGGGGGSGESASVKRCVCSPSQHPGSFRCRQHHREYVWRGRTIK